MRRDPPAGCGADDPFFTEGGLVWRTSNTLELVREIGQLNGIVPAELQANAFRSGGATDLAAEIGRDAGARRIRQRGRWHSDIYEIYARLDLSEALDTSLAISNAYFVYQHT